VTISESNVLLKPDTPAPDVDRVRGESARSENCAKIKGLGFTTTRHITMYGEQFEIVSDPFSDGDCVAVQATSGRDPSIRTLRLPKVMLVGSKDRFLKVRSDAG
jgi:hypothetical protein